MDKLHNEVFQNSNFYGSYGYLLTLDKQYERAEEIIKLALDFSENDKVSIDNLLALYIEQERWDEAVEQWNILEDKFPNFPEAFYHGAQINIHLGNLVEAKELIEKCETFKLYALSTITLEDIELIKSKL